jgi:hypothetical protein
MLKSR